MTSNKAPGFVLFFSLVAGLFSLSVLSWADDSESSPQWCSKAKTKVEKLICEDGELLEFDQESSTFYEALLTMVGPSAKSELVRSQRKWIAERERCGVATKTAEDLLSCVDTKIHQRSDLLRKGIQERNVKKRLSEFAKLELRTFRNTAFEFQYPISWELETTEDGRISLKSEPEEMSLGFETTVKSPKECTYSEEGSSEEEIRRFFYEGKKQIGRQEFDSFHRRWLPSGEDRHYYGFLRGRCFTIHVSDNSQAASNCGRLDEGRDRADCTIAELEAKDLLAYSVGVIGSLRFLSNQM